MEDISFLPVDSLPQYLRATWCSYIVYCMMFFNGLCLLYSLQVFFAMVYGVISFFEIGWLDSDPQHNIPLLYKSV